MKKQMRKLVGLVTSNGIRCFASTYGEIAEMHIGPCQRCVGHALIDGTMIDNDRLAKIRARITEDETGHCALPSELAHNYWLDVAYLLELVDAINLHNSSCTNQTKHETEYGRITSRDMG